MYALHQLKENKRKRESIEARHGEQETDEVEVQEGVKAEVKEERKYMSPWDEFTQEELEMFPALRKRNFWCVQRHQARALHYDLRMQLDGSTFSWAIPRGLLGMDKSTDRNRLAVETTLHPISYTTYEGGDGRVLPSGERCGTLLWDIGSYTVDYPWRGASASDSDDDRRRHHESDSDPTGSHEEDKFRMAMNNPIRSGKTRSIHFTLRGGRKLKNNSYILILTPKPIYKSTGKEKVNWFISLPKGVKGYPWGEGGEEGEEHGRSVKTGRTLRQVCAAMERTGPWTEDRDGPKRTRTLHNYIKTVPPSSPRATPSWPRSPKPPG